MNTSTKSKTSFIMPDKNVTITPNWTSNVPSFRVDISASDDVPIHGAGAHPSGTLVNTWIECPAGGRPLWSSYSDPGHRKSQPLYNASGMPLSGVELSKPSISFMMPWIPLYLKVDIRYD